MALPADDLLLFARVMEAGSLTAAAERMGWPKSTVSRRLAALEAAVGERLLLRTTRRLTLTDLGAGLLEHARQIAAQVDEAQAFAAHRQERPSGRLRVSMPADLAESVFATALADFVRAHPAIELDLDLSSRRVDLISENIDVALRIDLRPEDAQLAARQVAVFESSLYAAPDYLALHPPLQAPADLLQHHALLLRRPDGDPQPWSLLHPDASQAWRGTPPSHTVANLPALHLALARRGAGIVLASNLMAHAWVRQGALVPVLPAWRGEPHTAWAVFPSRRWMPLRTRLFIEALVQAAQATMAQCQALDPGGPPALRAPAPAT